MEHGKCVRSPVREWCLGSILTTRVIRTAGCAGTNATSLCLGISSVMFWLRALTQGGKPAVVSGDVLLGFSEEAWLCFHTHSSSVHLGNCPTIQWNQNKEMLALSCLTADSLSSLISLKCSGFFFFKAIFFHRQRRLC